jgi:hypothetical protein
MEELIILLLALTILGLALVGLVSAIRWFLRLAGGGARPAANVPVIHDDASDLEIAASQLARLRDRGLIDFTTYTKVRGAIDAAKKGQIVQKAPVPVVLVQERTLAPLADRPVASVPAETAYAGDLPPPGRSDHIASHTVASRLAAPGHLLHHHSVCPVAVAGVMAGIFLRIQSFLFLGASFLTISIAAIIRYATIQADSNWPWMIAGLVLGAGIVTVFALFEKKREDMLSLVEGLKQWEK